MQRRRVDLLVRPKISSVEGAKLGVLAVFEGIVEGGKDFDAGIVFVCIALVGVM